MGYRAAILVCGSRSPRWNFLFRLLEYNILSLCSFETSGSTRLTTHCHITEHLIADHTSRSSPSRTGPQHELRKHFSFFYVRTLLEEGLSDPANFSSFTHVPPGVTAMEFIARTISSEVSFGMYISRWQIYGFNSWTEACTTFWLQCVWALFSHGKSNEDLTDKNLVNFLNIGQPKKVDPLALPEQSQE